MKGSPKQARSNSKSTQQSPGIAERVRFWEEQDRINQILIPRVIRQHELLTRHIQEHDSLPELFRRQLQDALGEQSRQFEREQRKSLDSQSELFRRRLDAALEEQSRRFEEERRLLRWLVIGAFVVSLTAMIVSLWA
jgi:hypothetical protein